MVTKAQLGAVALVAMDAVPSSQKFPETLYWVPAAGVARLRVLPMTAALKKVKVAVSEISLAMVHHLFMMTYGSG